MTDRHAKGMKRLLIDSIRAATGAKPDESGAGEQGQSIDDERLLSAIRGEEKLTPAERRRILLSSDLHVRYSVLSAIERICRIDDEAEKEGIAAAQKETYDVWAARGWNVSGIKLLAAADDGSEVNPIHFDLPLYTIDMIPIDARGQVWRIDLQVGRTILDDFLERTPRGFRLIDDEGEVWAEGHPDKQGVLVGFWERREDLRERLKRVTLAVEPR